MYVRFVEGLRGNRRLRDRTAPVVYSTQYKMRWPKYTKAKQDEAILQNSEVVNEIPIINSLEKGNITRALKGERVGTIIFKE